MKNFKFVMLFCLLTSIALGQKIIEKNMDYSNQFIDLDVKFARTIEVKTWDQQKVYFKATIVTEDNQFIDQYDIDFKETRNTITITEKAEAMFEAMRDYADKNEKGKRRYWYNSGDRYKFFYVLYVPKNANFKVESINGDLESEQIVGNFEADLINGDIEISSYSGDLKLHTINGEIDLKVGNSSFTAETIHGDIYADENLKLTSSNRHVGQKVASLDMGKTNKLELNTINGNMYLRL